VLCFLNFLWQQCLRTNDDLLARYGGKGTWALVTGTTDGMGRVYCLALAKQGFNIVLVSRYAEKLEIIAKEIKEANPNIKVKILVKDFCGASKMDFYSAIGKEVRDLDIGLCVINASLCTVGPF